jgi:sugar phosphate isomerase/epimerase
MQRIPYGIWTSYYMDMSPEETVRHLAGLGWRDIELSTEHMQTLLQDGNAPRRLRTVRSLVESEGVTLWQAHLLLGLDLAKPDRVQYQQNLDTARRWLDGFQALAIPNIVIHPGGRFEGTYSDADWQQVRELNYSAFRSLSEHTGGTSLRLCLENLMDGKRRRFGAQITELLDIVEKVGSDRIGICMDTGHAQVQGLDVPAAVKQCGSLLWAAHIADNDGSGDQHLFPYAIRDCLVWPDIVAAFYEIDYRGLWNMEVPGESHGCPMAVRDAKLRYAHELLEIMLSPPS